MTPFDFILIGMATWRLSSMLVNEAGPFDMFQTLRDKLGVYPVKVGDTVQCQSKHAIWGMFCCVWCMSVWVSALMLTLYTIAPIMVYWLAISTLAVIVQEALKRA